MLVVDRNLAGIENQKLYREEKIKTRQEDYINNPSTSTSKLCYLNKLKIKLNKECFIFFSYKITVIT
jgi:hypothetical protein